MSADISLCGGFTSAGNTQATIEALRAAAQLAVQVEFTTIPAYLTALYSITDTASEAYQHLRSVVMEEMYHVNQAANILIGLGGVPQFTGTATPVYPGKLPGANPETTPTVGLYRASPEVFGNVFAAIETPAPANAPPQGSNYDSIAQLYHYLWDAIYSFDGNPFDQGTVGGRQREDIYLGKFGGNVIPVTDKESCCRAITEIVKQGEGSVPLDSPLIPIQSYGSYNHYGKRTDGTYGPILGTPYEMSHFIKFRSIAQSSSPFPPTLPITSNPNPEEFSNPQASAQAATFDLNYSVMLRALEQTFTAEAPDPYFGVVLNMMHRVLPKLARALMNTPAFSGGDASVGPNAAPAWRYVDNSGFAMLELSIAAIIEAEAKAHPQPNARVRESLTVLDEALVAVREMRPMAEKLGL